MTLQEWQEKLNQGKAAMAKEAARMARRERLYAGDRTLKALTAGDHDPQTGENHRAIHVRNLCAELIEAQVDSGQPAPKVTARRAEDEDLAQRIEAFLRNEMDRLPMEQINDLLERIVPIQGGAAVYLDWDAEAGGVDVRPIHPRQIIPQPGITTGVEDMDWLIISIPTTRAAVRERYRKDADEDVAGDLESGRNEEQDAGDAVTLRIGWEKRGSEIDRLIWSGDTELERTEKYQRRRQKRCERCGSPKTEEGSCACGGKWVSVPADKEVLEAPAVLRSGEILMPGTEIPVFVPGGYPVIIRRSIKAPDNLLGISDLDLIEDQQLTTNRLESKIIDKLLKSGSYITLPDDAAIRVDTEDMKVIRPGSHQNKELIGVYDLQGNIQQDLVYLAQVYEEARQAIGITDSFQGRRDATATSGRAKEFSAAQAAGRMASKRVMKRAFYADLFEAVFRLQLAYGPRQREITREDPRGGTEYGTLNRFDFLERDAAGELRWNDRFLFSADETVPLAQNREALWNEARSNLQMGAYGNPTERDTLILFWTQMAAAHYPGAQAVLSAMKDKQAEEMQAMQQMQMSQLQIM